MKMTVISAQFWTQTAHHNIHKH